MKKVYLIAVVFALLAGFATYMFATQIDKKSTIKDADTVAVVIALQDIPKNTIITDAMFAEDAGYFTIKSDVVAADATPAPISDYSQISGMITAVDIYAGEQMNEHKFISSDDENVGLSFKLSPNKVAYSFSAGSTTGVDGYICAGDTVSGTKKRESQSEAFTAAPFKYTFAPIPLTEEGGYFIDSPSVEFSVNKDGDHVDMTNEFMRFLITDSELKEMASVKRLVTPTRDLSFDAVYAPFGQVPADRTISPEVLGITDPLTVQIRIAAYQVGKGEITVDDAVTMYGTFE